MTEPMVAPDLGLDPFSNGASESGAAGALEGYGNGASSQGAAAGVAPNSNQAPAPSTGVAGPAGATPTDEVRTVPATDLDNLRSTYDRRLAQVQETLQAQQGRETQLARALWELQTANLPPEQRREAEAALAFQGQLQQLVQAAAAQQQQMETLEPIFKKMAVDELSEQFKYAGITRKELEQFDDPALMERYCQALGERYKTQQAQQRQPANRAAAGASGQPAGNNWAKMDMSDLVSLAFGN